MKFGLFLPTLTGWSRTDEDRNGGFRLRYERTYEICELAEELGFDFVTLGQHRFTPQGVDPSAPLTVLSALAARTHSLRLATNIIILGAHNPVEVAEQVATIDEMSGGRIILGVGLGYRPYEFESIGLDYRQRVSRFEEAVDVVRRCWSGNPVNFDGQHFTIKKAEVSPLPFQRAGPPIWIGAQSEKAVMRAARIGDGWLTDNVFSATAFVPLIKRYRAAAENYGSSAVVAMNRKILIGSSRKHVEEKWLPQALDFFREFPALGAVFDDKRFMEKLVSREKIDLDDVPDDQLIAGTPDDCIKALRKVERLTGCDYIVVDFGSGAHGQQFEELKSAIELFGRTVMPEFSN